MRPPDRAGGEILDGPPWRLIGRGFVLLFRAGRSANVGRSTAGPRPALSTPRGFGALLLIDYSASTVGPYRECMWIPGAVRSRPLSPEHQSGAVEQRAVPESDEAARTGGALLKGHTIERVVVTSERSVRAGTGNWAIPKELGAVTWVRGGSGGERITVVDGSGRTIVELSIRVGGPLKGSRIGSLPFSSLLLPRTLLQQRAGAVYRTRIAARGRIRPAHVERLSGGGKCFGQVGKHRIIGALLLESFTLYFPPAEIFLPRPVLRPVRARRRR
ncbi:MAG TPA: hypothetical protein VMV68_01965 [Spirochaetia bacterium]|nr:hypothetical protein [Spirochaetia bacterium]